MLENIKLIRSILLEREEMLETPSCMKDIQSFLTKMKVNKNHINFSYMLYYLFSKVSSDEVAKRKTSARELEDFLASIFGGTIQDTTKRKNNQDYETVIKDLHIREYVLSNMREKIDILFDKYSVSVKTLMFDNKEINMGAFEKTALFSGFDIVDFLNERGKNKTHGLGSSVQLNNLLTHHIYEKNRWEEFVTRFLGMSEDIFSHGLIIAIKNNIYMDIYCLESEDVISVIKKHTINPDIFTRMVNRWEGNSIRIKREPFLLEEVKVTLDFSYLDQTVVYRIKIFEEHLNCTTIKYANNIYKKDESILKLIEELKSIFNTI